MSTVSHALSGKRPVSDATRTKIFEAIAELGYQPSTHAQSLVTGRSRTIGILFPLESQEEETTSLNNTQFEMILQANSVAQANGYRLHVFTQAEDKRLLRNWCRMCDGLLVASVRLNDTRIDYLIEENYPFVTVGRPAQANRVAWVDTDFEDMVMKQISHLFELGHRHILFLDRPERLFLDQFGYIVRARQGYLKACATLHLKPIIHACEVSTEDGYRTLGTVLDAHPKLTALAAFNDVAAVGAYYSLLNRGLRIPEDFSIITFTSAGFLRSSVPGMTAMNNTGSSVSKTAADMLLAKLMGYVVNQTQILVKSELILGWTTGPVRERESKYPRTKVDGLSGAHA